MRPATKKPRLRARRLMSLLAVGIAALLSFGPRSFDAGGAEAEHRSGFSGEVRIVAEAQGTWAPCSEGRRA